MSYGNLQSLTADAMAANGARPLDPRDLRTDGTLARFPCEGDKAGRRNGWCVIFTGARPVAVYGHWGRNLGPITQALGTDSPRLTAAEAEAARLGYEQARRARDSELATRHQAARTRAQRDWFGAHDASAEHPYLKRKGLQAHGLREAYGQLLVPMHDADGELWSTQQISADGRKRFPFGSRIKGLFHRIGTEPGEALLIAEGFATAAALYEATGTPTYAAMTAGNLITVARSLRTKYPDADIVICADNDAETEQRTGCNPGLAAATAAASEVRGRVAMPPDGANDFSDYFSQETCL